MSKDNIFIGQPIFSQLLKLISRSDISIIEQKHLTNRYTKRLDGPSHFVALLFSVFSRCDSLREVGWVFCRMPINCPT